MSVKDLGIYLDSDASTRTHVSNTVSHCFAAPPSDAEYSSLRFQALVMLSLVVSLVLQRLDYGNATLVAVPA